MVHFFPHEDHHHIHSAFPVKAVDHTDMTSTGPVLTQKADGVGDGPAPYNTFRQYSWAAASPFQKLMRELWRYVQSFEDEHYQIYYKRNINEETLKDYSSAIQEIIPRLAKVQSILNQNSRGFPDMLRWSAPTDAVLDIKSTIKDTAQDCEEFSIMAHDAAVKGAPVSAATAGAVIQSALACQAAASKAAIALQRGKFGDPVCDPATVMQNSASMNSLIATASMENRRISANEFL